MKTMTKQARKKAGGPLPLLANGDRMKQPEFHRRYQAYPDGTKFELVGGTVYMTSPLRWPHGNYHLKLGLALELYASATPGVEAGDNATSILGEESEPQPDLALRLLPEYGGQSRENAERYIEGAPELLAEIAYSTRSLDLNQKRQDYENAGVMEYLVLCIEEQELHWFHFPSGKAIRPNRQGISCSKVFPGLWIDAQALLARNSARVAAVIQQGLASPQHATFVKRLERAYRRRS
jgi:Uma2 family endonuclease